MIYSAIIDSGADYCIFSIDTARALNINLSQANKAKFIGVGGESVEGFWEQITLRIGDVTYKTDVIFAEISDFGHGILGQKGFFDHFDVKLSYKQQLIEVQAVDNP